MALDRYWPEVRNIFAFIVANRTMYLLVSVGLAMPALITYLIWRAVYLEGGGFDALSAQQMMTYIFVAYFCYMLSAFEMEAIIGNDVRSGDIVKDLVLPQSFMGKRLAMGLGWLSGVTLFSALPMLTAAVLFLGISLPSLSALPYFLLSLLLSMFVNFGLSYLVGICAFWMGNVWGMSAAKGLLASFLGGVLVPIYFFPDWAQQILQWLPFQAAIHTPTAIYLGTLSGQAALVAMGVQAVWAVALVAVGDWFFHFSMRRVTIHGG